MLNGTRAAAEAENFEVLDQSARRLREMAYSDYEAATQELVVAQKRVQDLDNMAGQLAAHGIGDPLMRALADMSETATRNVETARTKVADADQGKRAADALAAELKTHQNLADAVASTPGAARDTGFYGGRR